MRNLIISNTLGLSILLSQFYIFQSGIPQPAHFLLLLGCVLIIIRKRGFYLPQSIKNFTNILIVFLFYSLSINFIFGITESSTEFIHSTAYNIYGCIICLLVLQFNMENENSAKIISLYSFLGLLLLTSIGAIGYGEYKFYPRYNAFFNDPNQMAFWALCTFSIILLTKEEKFLVKSISFFCTSYIIMLSASRSGLVGFAILSTGFILNTFSTRSKSLSIILNRFIIMISITILGGYFMLNKTLDTVEFLSSRVEIVDVNEQSEIRGYTRILDFPQYIILGSGQGLDDRFIGEKKEIHSTWAGLLFYYGIPGLLLIISLIIMVSKKLTYSEILIFLGPLFYSISTYGLRTPIFWIFLAVAATTAFRINDMKNKNFFRNTEVQHTK